MELGVAIVGVGKWGKNVARAFGRATACRVHALCDLDEAALEASVEAFPNVRRTSSFEDVLAERAVEAVALATPAETHGTLTLACLGAGKDVFVEKPMVLTVADAERVKRAAERTGRRVMVGHILHYHPAVRELLGLLERGELGQLQRAVAERTGPARPGRDVSAWWALAPHDISLLRRVFAADPTEIRAKGESLDGGIGEDLVTAELCFGQHGTAHLRVGSAPAKARRLVVMGSEGTAVFDDLEETAKLRIKRGAGDGEAWLDRAAARDFGDVVPTPRDEPLLAEVQHFVDSVRQGTPFRTGVEDGLQVTQALEAGSLSISRRGSAVAIE